MIAHPLTAFSAIVVVIAGIFGVADIFLPAGNQWAIGFLIIAAGIISEYVAEKRGQNIWSPYFALCCVAVLTVLLLALIWIVGWFMDFPGPDTVQQMRSA